MGTCTLSLNTTIYDLMKDFQLSIPKPCPANWDQMSPAGNGKYCGSCEKIVVDFTEMTDADIKNYFQQHIGQKTCGHYKAHQVSIQHNQVQRFLLDLAQQVEGKMYGRPIRISLLFLLGAVMFLAGCKPTLTGKPKIVEGSSFNSPLHEEYLTGDTSYVPSNTQPVEVLT